MYYRMENGSIIDFGNTKYSENCLETDKNIITAYDGNMYFEDEIPIKPLSLVISDTLAEYDAAVDDRLEAFARELYSKGYANAVTYVNSANAQWRLEAQYLIALRDETWQAAYVYMNEVMPLVAAGERAVPALAEVFAALPTPAWPAGSRGYVAG